MSNKERAIWLTLLISLGVATYVGFTKSFPEPVKAEPVLVVVTDESGVRVSDQAIEQLALKIGVGKWNVQAVPAPGEKGFSRTITVSEGVKPTPPPEPTPPTPPGPTPPPPPPPVDIPDALQPAANALRSTPAGKTLSGFYRQFALILGQAEAVKTVGQFRTVHAEALRGLVAAGYTGPKVGTYIDAYLAEVIGLEADAEFDRAMLTSALNTIADSIGG